MHLNLSADVRFNRPDKRNALDGEQFQAPTGSNSQGWHWIVIEDAAKKKALADIYRKNFALYASMPGREYKEGDTRGERQPLVRDSAGYLTDNFEKAPMMMIPCIDGRLDNLPAFAGSCARCGLF